LQALHAVHHLHRLVHLPAGVRVADQGDSEADLSLLSQRKGLRGIEDKGTNEEAVGDGGRVAMPCDLISPERRGSALYHQTEIRPLLTERSCLRPRRVIIEIDRKE
jgi:hypothetical protein